MHFDRHQGTVIGRLILHGPDGGIITSFKSHRRGVPERIRIQEDSVPFLGLAITAVALFFPVNYQIVHFALNALKAICVTSEDCALLVAAAFRVKIFAR